MVCLDNSLTQTISPTTQPNRFSSPSHISTRNLIIRDWVLNCSTTPYWEFDWHLSKIVSQSNILNLIFLCSSIYIPLITVLVCKIVLLLILLILTSLLFQLLVVLISPLAPCILSLMLVYTSYFDSQLDEQRKFSKRETPTS